MAFTLATGSAAPEFSLPATDGKNYSFDNLKGEKGTLIIFSCNHCPYVIGSEDRMIQLYNDYSGRGISMAAINSNETDNHPTDDFDHMVQRVQEKSIPFPYLRDESQQTAIDYGALRTPHFYLFDQNGKLIYNGRMDDNPKDASQAETHELRDALDELLEGKNISVPETQPVGCNVKWWGKDAHWIPGDACDVVPKKL